MGGGLFCFAEISIIATTVTTPNISVSINGSARIPVTGVVPEPVFAGTVGIKGTNVTLTFDVFTGNALTNETVVALPCPVTGVFQTTLTIPVDGGGLGTITFSIMLN